MINFWISQVEQYEETMANEQIQNGRGGYQMEEITYVHLRLREDVGRIEKSVIRSTRTK